MRSLNNALRAIFGGQPSWFDRYTEHARRTIFFGRWEALQRGADFIEPEHIALGLLRDEWLVNEFLSQFQVEELRATILAHLPPAREARADVDLPLSDRSKQVLTNAAADADVLLDQHIGDEHLLLGSLREERTSKRRALSGALSQRGLGLDQLWSQVKKIPRETRVQRGGAQAARAKEAGIPDGYAPSKLLYNPAAEVLVLELKAQAGDFYPKRLMTRDKGAERYEQVGSPPEDISFESAVICEKVPIALFNSMRMYRKKSGQYRAADWEAAYMFDLKTRELTVCVSKENFVVPQPYDERGWIKEILSLSNDASHAYVTVGLGKRQSTGEKFKVHYDYHLARLDLQTRKLELLSHLRNIIF